MGKRVIQKLCKHGSSTSVSLPRYLLFELGWVCGQGVIVELMEDQSLRVRLPRQEDFGPVPVPRALTMQPQPVTK